MGRHGEALAAFSQGLAQDPKSMQLLSGLVEAAMKSPLRGQCLRLRVDRARGPNVKGLEKEAERC